MTACILKTDRKKGNRVQDKDNVLYVLKWLERYDVKIVVKSHDWGTRHDMFSVHGEREDYFASGETLAEVHSKLMAIVALFQNKYFAETDKVENNSRFIWRLEKIE